MTTRVKHWRYEPNKSAINYRGKSFTEKYDIWTIRGVGTTFWVDERGQVLTTGKTGRKTALHIDELKRYLSIP